MGSMIKRLALLLLFLPGSLFATTTVTGTIQTLGTANVTSGAFVRFWLRGCAGNQPRVNGTALIGPTQGGVFYVDFAANSSGAISGTLFSTRDSTGLLAGDIECGGSKTAVWYGMQAFIAGRGGPEIPVHALNSATLDITQVTPITTTPVVTAPTGDTTYARLDGGNQPFTGNVTPNGNGTLNLGSASNRWNANLNTTNSTGAGTHSGTETFSGPLVNTGTDSGNQTIAGNKTYTGTDNFSTAIFGGKPWIDPTSSTYGAKCDGATDDSAALQAAFNAIPSAGATIFVPGVCTYASTITIPTTGLAAASGQYGGINVVGQGGAVSALKYTGSGSTGLSATASSGTSLWHLEFRNLAITTDSSSFNGNLLFTQNINRVVLDNVWVTCINNTTQSNQCDVDLTGQVGVTFTFDIQVNNCAFSGASLDLIGIDDSRISGGQIYPDIGVGPTTGRKWGIKFNSQNIQIDGVHLGTPNGNSAGSIFGTGSAAITARIENNWFDPDSNGGSHNGTNIFFDSNVSSTQIIANQFTGPGTSILFSAGAIETNIASNTFTNPGNGASLAGGFNTIVFNGSPNTQNAVWGNIFTGTNTLTAKNFAIAEGGASAGGLYGPNTIVGIGTGYQAKPISFGVSSTSRTLSWVGLSAIAPADLALGGNWGTSPSVSVNNGFDRGGSITVTSGSGSPGANPTVTLTFKSGMWPSTPACIVSRNDGNAPSTGVWLAQPQSANSVLFVFEGTPSASTAYQLSYHCGADIP